MTELRGELEAYYEQGWEGRIEFAFQFERNQNLLLRKNERT